VHPGDNSPCKRENAPLSQGRRDVHLLGGLAHSS
jgi:hypothetical protein